MADESDVATNATFAARAFQEAEVRQLMAEKEAEYLISGYQDKATIYRSTDKQWRWKRVAPNGQIVGASSESYRAYSDCLKNYRRQGVLVEISDVEVEE